MRYIFWFNGRSGSGKTTIVNEIKKLLDNDFKIEFIDGDKIVTNLGGIEFRKKNMDVFIKKAVTMAEISSKKYHIVLVSILCPKQKHQNFAREVLGSKYHEIFLQCSELCCAERVLKRITRKSIIIRRFIEKLCTTLALIDYKPNSYVVPKLAECNPKSYYVPKSTDFIINTERQTIDESVKIAVNYMQTIIIPECKN